MDAGAVRCDDCRVGMETRDQEIYHCDVCGAVALFLPSDSTNEKKRWLLRGYRDR